MFIYRNAGENKNWNSCEYIKAVELDGNDLLGTWLPGLYALAVRLKQWFTAKGVDKQYD